MIVLREGIGYAAVVSHSTKKILFIQTAFLGDVLLTIPSLRRLKVKYPGAQISLITRKGLGEILKKLNLVDNVYEVDKGSAHSYQQVQQALKLSLFDLLITPHESFRTGYFAWKISALEKIGPRTFYNFLFFDRLVRKNKQLPEPLRVLQFCDELAQPQWSVKELYAIENNKLKVDTSFASMSCRDEISAWHEYGKMETQFGLQRKRVLLFPGSVWETKKYPVHQYLEVTKTLIQKGFSVVLMGAKNEVHLGEQIQKGLDQPILNLIGQTSLAETLCLMALSGCVLGNDSGSSHLASVAGCPSVTVFGPTIVEFGYRPWSNQSYIVQTAKQLSCRPCGSHGHHACPIGTHVCMTSIAPAEVLEIVEGVLA